MSSRVAPARHDPSRLAKAERDPSTEYSSGPSRPGLHDASSAPGDDASRPSTTGRTCAWCREGIPTTARRDSIYCSKRCRQASWRFGTRRSSIEAAAQPMRFAYADPPYPGKASYYPERQEVDHPSLLEHLTAEYPDGWALSTSASALRTILPLCPPDIRVCAWVRTPRPAPSYRPLNAWEPLIVAGGRPRPVVDDVGHRVVQDLRDTLTYGGRYRAFPGALVGMKPPQFAAWMFDQLGAAPGDTLEDLYPGSGAISEAWRRYTSQEAA